MATPRTRQPAHLASLRRRLTVANNHLRWAESDLDYEKWHEIVERLTALLKQETSNK